MKTINGIELNKTEVDTARKGLEVVNSLALVTRDSQVEAAVATCLEAVKKYGAK